MPQIIWERLAAVIGKLCSVLCSVFETALEIDSEEKFKTYWKNHLLNQLARHNSNLSPWNKDTFLFR